MFLIMRSMYRIVPLLSVLLSVISLDVHAIGVSSNIKSHVIEVEFSLNENKLIAEDHVCVQKGESNEVLFLINKSFKVTSIASSGKDLAFKPGKAGNAQTMKITVPATVKNKETICFDIKYEGILPALPGSFSGEDIGATSGIIGEYGVYLSPAYRWYPDMSDSLATFKVTVVMPKEYEAVTQGILVSKKTEDNKVSITWEEDSVSEGCSLVAGKYKVTAVRYNDIDIYAYFYPEEQPLVDTYLDATKRYLDIYHDLIGKYPYKKFAIVENFFQTGYGMPSFTLLGSEVVKLPFIVDISLGHEVLHNWWGNSVFVDDSRGNWCEGLTAYMADYYYKEIKGDATATTYRNEICRKYTHYVTTQNDFPLKMFLGRSDKATQAIGYGKTAMVFHMLRKMLGDEVFYQALKDFYKNMLWQRANWEDIEKVFEKVSGLELAWFFDQWVNKKGAPVIELGKTTVNKEGNAWVVKAEILQKTNEPYRLHLPVYLQLEDGIFHTTAEIKNASDLISLEVKSRPENIAIDPYTEVFRRLHADEIPPTIDLVMGDSKIILYPSNCEDSMKAEYKKLAHILANERDSIKADTEITEAEIAQTSLFILGGVEENKISKLVQNNLPVELSLTKDAFGADTVMYGDKKDAFLVTIKHPSHKEKGIALFAGFSPEAVNKAGYKIQHYGKYSYLVFSDGNNRVKEVVSIGDSPLQRILH
ncbi:M1 family aminopeptidase [Candidatus Kuenenia sp.]|uniref:M1 family metallopeptidase n=1 Tax=Candidatus Kuenenia sp. TaxID=2499824 RepID=UPI00321FB151